MICTYCGNALSKNNDHCSYCRAPVSMSTARAAAGHSAAELELLMKPAAPPRRNRSKLYVAAASALVIVAVGIGLLTSGWLSAEKPDQAEPAGEDPSNIVVVADNGEAEPADEVLADEGISPSSTQDEQASEPTDEELVAEAMEQYQMYWSIALTEADMSLLTPYITLDKESPNSVYRTADNQVKGLAGLKKGGTLTEYAKPDYETLEMVKVSDSHYQVKIKKRVMRTMRKGEASATLQYKETAYTYNVVKLDDKWLVDSTDDSSIPSACYTDDTYTKKKACN